MAKVLIVDDTEFLRTYLSKMLSMQGHELYQAVNGLQAVHTYKELQPDVVLMDVTMPEMDGLTALKKIIEFDTRARVIMLSALGQESVMLEAARAGAKDFVVKPFEPNRVINAIAKLLS